MFEKIDASRRLNRRASVGSQMNLLKRKQSAKAGLLPEDGVPEIWGQLMDLEDYAETTDFHDIELPCKEFRRTFAAAFGDGADSTAGALEYVSLYAQL